MKKIYIQADRVATGDYVATEASHDINNLLFNYEYGDVVAEEYQIWEYPSGRKYKVTADTFVDHIEEDDFSTPDSKKWLPVIDYVSTDKVQVKAGYERLYGEESASVSSAPRG